jgi:hypothetical protein
LGEIPFLAFFCVVFADFAQFLGVLTSFGGLERGVLPLNSYILIIDVHPKARVASTRCQYLLSQLSLHWIDLLQCLPTPKNKKKRPALIKMPAYL